MSDRKTEIYEIALSEFETDRDEALWIRAQVESGSDEGKARLRYIELRVLELAAENDDTSEVNIVQKSLSPETEMVDTPASVTPVERREPVDGWIYLAESEAKSLDYYGVGGWAYLLVFGLAFGPLRLLAEFYGGEPVDIQWLRATGLFQWYSLEEIVTWSLAAVSWVLLYGLFKRKEWFQPTYLWTALIAAVWPLIDAIVVVSLMQNINSEVTLADVYSSSDIGEWIGSLIPIAIWSAYVHFSRRINVTTRLRIREKWLADLP